MKDRKEVLVACRRCSQVRGSWSRCAVGGLRCWQEGLYRERADAVMVFLLGSLGLPG
ncbi:hypothetical protein BDZ45DRAFT_681081 [Acephala macrosclerotiorum]|nr:hypothetical protein BDZ45DRAFT_681081 [Acephala macrosclerotiorum]